LRPRAAVAKSLVTSLWRSNDVVTRKMMRGFYESLVGKAHAGDLFEGAESLRKAQLARVAREQRLKLRIPLTWANFIYSGLY
jgi:CHAT domain-containing protein